MKTLCKIPPNQIIIFKIVERVNQKIIKINNFVTLVSTKINKKMRESYSRKNYLQGSKKNMI